MRLTRFVQFYEYGGGSVFQVAASLNGVTYAPTSPIATPIPDTSGTSTSTSRSNAALPALHIPPGLFAGLLAASAGALLGAWSVL